MTAGSACPGRTFSFSLHISCNFLCKGVSELKLLQARYEVSHLYCAPFNSPAGGSVRLRSHYEGRLSLVRRGHNRGETFVFG